jgi:NADPH2:quinone reductase
MVRDTRNEVTMKAVRCIELGGPDKLRVEDIERPEPGAGEVRLKVAGCGVNFADSLIIQGKYQVRPDLPFTPGMEVAGKVTALGANVDGLERGQLVVGMTGTGGFAEEVICPARDVMPCPEGLDPVIAAALPVAYGTAHLGLERRARLRPGETLLVHGASGGVGLAAVEVGKRMGATVIATASSADKLEIAAEHGADHLIDYAEGAFKDRVRELTGGRGADVIFDPVGGDVFDESLRCIAWEGRLLVVGFASGRIPQAPANLMLVKNMAVMGVFWGAYRDKDPKVMTASFATLAQWLKEGALKPLVSRTYGLEDTGQAIADLMERRAKGKIVVTP